MSFGGVGEMDLWHCSVAAQRTVQDGCKVAVGPIYFPVRKRTNIGPTSDRHRTRGVCDARWLEGMKKVPNVFWGNGWAPLSFDIEYWSDGCVQLLA